MARAPRALVMFLSSGFNLFMLTLVTMNIDGDASQTCNALGCECNPGFTGPAGGPCVACDIGTYKSTNGTQMCEQCETGTFSNTTGSSTCSKCPAGSTTTTSGAIARINCTCTLGHLGGDGGPCTACEAGKFMPSGVDTCMECPAGTFQHLDGGTECFECNSGSFQSSSGASFCERCPAGGYCLSTQPDKCGGDFVPCPPGTYNQRSGSDSRDDCRDCAAGTYSLQTGARSIDACTPCSRNTFGAERGLRLCEQCAAGSYQDEWGATGCKQCIAGHFCPEGSDPAPCPAGTRSSGSQRIIMARATDCIECLSGHYCPSGSANQTQCAAGTFSSQPSAAKCDRCPGGSYQSSTGATSCNPCTPGHFCPEGASHPTPCPSGTFSNSTWLASASACSACPRGHACSAGLSDPLPCSAGSHAMNEGASSCDLCPAGFFQAASGQAECDKCDPGTLCSRGAELQRPAACQPGTWADGADSDGEPDCFECPRGAACAGGPAAPRPCAPGTFAASSGRDECDVCAAGRYQPEPRSTACLLCTPAHFCPSGASVPQPCPLGTRHNAALESMGDADDCVVCGAGRWCAVGSLEAADCPPGTFGERGGVGQCEPCPAGSYSRAGATSCQLCPEGTFANRTGQSVCTPCPHPLSSGNGSTQCSVCLPGFYRAEPAAGSEEEAAALVDNSSGPPGPLCKACPSLSTCAHNTSLRLLPVPPSYWRSSPYTERLYKCFEDADGYSPCRGSTDELQSGRRSQTADAAVYCRPGHRGPLCEICTPPEQYFAPGTGRCEDCPLDSAGVFIGVVVAILAALGPACAIALKCVGQPLRRRLTALWQCHWHAKVKVVIGFAQVVSALDSVYGVNTHRAFTGWFVLIGMANLDLYGLLLPGTCGGEMQSRLIVAALWPYAAEAALLLGLVLHGCLAPANTKRVSCGVKLRNGLLRVAVFVSFLVLPKISRGIFSARECVSFQHDDLTDERRSYLRADPDVACNNGDITEHSGLVSLFWFFFVLWPLLVPLAFLWLVHFVRGSIRRQQISDADVANAIRFLWRDYRPEWMYWESVDMAVRLVLTSLILFVDAENGSERLMRVVIAAAVCVSHAALLAVCRPYKRLDDFYLACASHLLLAMAFVMAIVVKLCDADGEACADLVGIVGSHDTTLLAAFPTVLIAGALLALLLGATATADLRTVRLASSGRAPQLELPPSCDTHCFVSFARRSGQESSAELVRKLQILIPSLRVRCDVDADSDIAGAVSTAAVFVVFLSAGYFRSSACRRALYAAIALQKPIVAVQAAVPQGDVTLAAAKAECEHSCVDAGEYDDMAQHVPASSGDLPPWEGPRWVLRRVFADQPVVLVAEKDFEGAGLKEVCVRLLQKLPHNTEQDVDMGLELQREGGAVGFSAPVTLLYCAANRGADKAAAALQGASQEAAGSARLELVQASEENVDAMDHLQQDARTFLLLLLHQHSFVDHSVVATVHRALRSKIPVIVLHDQDLDHGGCPLDELYVDLPAELAHPIDLFSRAVIVPLYSPRYLQHVSLRLALGSMGATALGQGRRSLARVDCDEGGDVEQNHAEVGRSAIPESESSEEEDDEDQDEGQDEEGDVSVGSASREASAQQVGAQREESFNGRKSEVVEVVHDTMVREHVGSTGNTANQARHEELGLEVSGSSGRSEGRSLTGEVVAQRLPPPGRQAAARAAAAASVMAAPRHIVHGDHEVSASAPSGALRATDSDEEAAKPAEPQHQQQSVGPLQQAQGDGDGQVERVRGRKEKSGVRKGRRGKPKPVQVTEQSESLKREGSGGVQHKSFRSRQRSSVAATTPQARLPSSDGILGGAMARVRRASTIMMAWATPKHRDASREWKALGSTEGDQPPPLRPARAAPSTDELEDYDSAADEAVEVLPGRTSSTGLFGGALDRMRRASGSVRVSRGVRTPKYAGGRGDEEAGAARTLAQDASGVWSDRVSLDRKPGPAWS